MNKVQAYTAIIKHLALTGAIVFAFAPVMARGNYEFKTYTSNIHTVDCNFADRASWDDLCAGFHDNVVSSASWDSIGEIVNTHNRTAFADPAVQAWGNDPNELDNADAAIICGHGGDQDSGAGQLNGPNGWYTVLATKSTSCYSNRQDMRLGNTDLEYLFLSSCHSLDYDDVNTWAGEAAGLHGVMGFHGIMWISASRIADYEDAGDIATTTGIRTGWFYELHEDSASADADQCPVTVFYGTTNQEALDRHTYASLNNYYNSVDPAPYYRALWVWSTCDPDEGGTWASGAYNN